VLSAHCPDGLTSAVWRGALTEFARLKAADEPMGQLLRPARDRNAAADASRRLAQMGAGAGAGAGARVGVVAQWLAQKRFGFVQEKGRGGKKVFFHLSVAAQGWAPQQVAVRVRVRVRVRVSVGVRVGVRVRVTSQRRGGHRSRWRAAPLHSGQPAKSALMLAEAECRLSHSVACNTVACRPAAGRLPPHACSLQPHARSLQPHTCRRATP
jgi:hypothetical protein